jgi:hypothetical protein
LARAVEPAASVMATTLEVRAVINNLRDIGTLPRVETEFPFLT